MALGPTINTGDVILNFSTQGAAQTERTLDRVSKATERTARRGNMLGKVLSRTFSILTAYALISGIRTLERSITGLASSVAESIGDFQRLALVIETAAARDLRASALDQGVVLKMADAYKMVTGHADKYLMTVKNMALTRPISEKQIGNTFRVLTGYQLGVDLAEAFTVALTDFTLATGKTSDDMYRMSLALGQVRSKGKLAGEEMRQLTNAGITQEIIVTGLNKLYPQMGVTIGNFYTKMREGALKSGPVLHAVLEELSEFAGRGRDLAKNWAGIPTMMANIHRVASRTLLGPAFSEMAKPLAEFIGLWDPGNDDYSKAEKGIASLGDALAEKIRAPMEWLRDEGVPAIEMFFSGLNISGSAGEKVINAIAKGLRLSIDELSLGGLGGALWEKLFGDANLAEVALGVTVSLGQMWVDIITSVIPKIAGFAYDMAVAFWSWVSGPDGAAAQALDHIDNLITSIAISLPLVWEERVKPALIYYSTAFWEWATVAASNTYTWLRNLATTIYTQLPIVWEDTIKPAVVDYSTRFWNWAVMAAQTGYVEVQNLGTAVYNRLAEIWTGTIKPQLLTWGRDIWLNIFSGQTAGQATGAPFTGMLEPAQFAGPLAELLSGMDQGISSLLSGYQGEPFRDAGEAVSRNLIKAAANAAKQDDYTGWVAAMAEGLESLSEDPLWRQSGMDLGSSIVIAIGDALSGVSGATGRLAAVPETILVNLMPAGGAALAASTYLAGIYTGIIEEAFKIVTGSDFSDESEKLIFDIYKQVALAGFAFIFPPLWGYLAGKKIIDAMKGELSLGSLDDDMRAYAEGFWDLIWSSLTAAVSKKGPLYNWFFGEGETGGGFGGSAEQWMPSVDVPVHESIDVLKQKAEEAAQARVDATEKIVEGERAVRQQLLLTQAATETGQVNTEMWSHDFLDTGASIQSVLGQTATDAIKEVNSSMLPVFDITQNVASEFSDEIPDGITVTKSGVKGLRISRDFMKDLSIVERYFKVDLPQAVKVFKTVLENLVEHTPLSHHSEAIINQDLQKTVQLLDEVAKGTIPVKKGFGNIDPFGMPLPLGPAGFTPWGGWPSTPINPYMLPMGGGGGSAVASLGTSGDVMAQLRALYGDVMGEVEGASQTLKQAVSAVGKLMGAAFPSGTGKGRPVGVEGLESWDEVRRRLAAAVSGKEGEQWFDRYRTVYGLGDEGADREAMRRDLERFAIDPVGITRKYEGQAGVDQMMTRGSENIMAKIQGDINQAQMQQEMIVQMMGSPDMMAAVQQWADVKGIEKLDEAFMELSGLTMKQVQDAMNGTFKATSKTIDSMSKKVLQVTKQAGETITDTLQRAADEAEVTNEKTIAGLDGILYQLDVIDGTVVTYEVIGIYGTSGGGGGGGGGDKNLPFVEPEEGSFPYSYWGQRGLTARVSGAGSGDIVPFSAMVEPGEVISIVPKKRVNRGSVVPQRVVNINVGSINNGWDAEVLKHQVTKWVGESIAG